MQGTIDGIRRVLPRLHNFGGPNGGGATEHKWTATIASGQRNLAWIYSGLTTNFNLTLGARAATTGEFRCVGRTDDW